MKHPLQEMMDKRRQGIRCGIPSYCSANELVIEIALRRAKERSIPVLIEATANQVNQFGGYTGMKPADFYQMVLKMAKDIGLPENMMILAGDHLGPLTWQKLPEAEAMKNSVELVYQYARAGFTKIHLDTSMKVADDAPGLLVKLAKQYTSAITIEKNGKTCDMRKLMAVMGMGIRQGETITVTAEGEDEAAAIEAVEKFLTENV